MLLLAFFKEVINMLNIFLIVMGCIHLFAVGVIVGFSITDHIIKKDEKETEQKLHELAKAVYILNNECRKLYNQVNKEDEKDEN